MPYSLADAYHSETAGVLTIIRVPQRFMKPTSSSRENVQFRTMIERTRHVPMRKRFRPAASKVAQGNEALIKKSRARDGAGKSAATERAKSRLHGERLQACEIRDRTAPGAQGTIDPSSSTDNHGAARVRTTRASRNSRSRRSPRADQAEEALVRHFSPRLTHFGMG